MAEGTSNKKNRSARKFEFRGLELDKLLEMQNNKESELWDLFRARMRRKFRRMKKGVYTKLLQRVRAAKKGLKPGEKPEPVRTHLRDAVVLPEMVGSIMAIHGGRGFTNIEVKFDMIGRYLGEFAITYKTSKHTKVGVGATKSSAHAK
jgi:small subunit ribosomal protein S15e